MDELLDSTSPGIRMSNTERLRELAISDAGFVFDPLTGHTYNVNATALAALRALKEGATPGLSSLLSKLDPKMQRAT